jgi:hypothetical protein
MSTKDAFFQNLNFDIALISGQNVGNLGPPSTISATVGGPAMFAIGTTINISTQQNTLTRTMRSRISIPACNTGALGAPNSFGIASVPVPSPLGSVAHLDGLEVGGIYFPVHIELVPGQGFNFHFLPSAAPADYASFDGVLNAGNAVQPVLAKTIDLEWTY